MFILFVILDDSSILAATPPSKTRVFGWFLMLRFLGPKTFPQRPVFFRYKNIYFFGGGLVVWKEPVLTIGRWQPEAAQRVSPKYFMRRWLWRWVSPPLSLGVLSWFVRPSCAGRCVSILTSFGGNPDFFWHCFGCWKFLKNCSPLIFCLSADYWSVWVPRGRFRLGLPTPNLNPYPEHLKISMQEIPWVLFPAGHQKGVHGGGVASRPGNFARPQTISNGADKRAQ